MKRNIIVILPFFILSCISSDKTEITQKNNIVQDEYNVELPLHYTENYYPLTLISINEIECYFIIDTGADTSIIFDNSLFNDATLIGEEKLKLPFINRILPFKVYRQNIFEISKDLQMRDFVFFSPDNHWTLDFDVNVVGILGRDFLAQFQVFFKNSSRLLVLSNNEIYKKTPLLRSGNYFNKNHMFIMPVTISNSDNESFEDIFFVDTGSAFGLTIPKEMDFELKKIGFDIENINLVISIFPSSNKLKKDFENRKMIRVNNNITEPVIGCKILNQFDWGFDLKNSSYLWK